MLKTAIPTRNSILLGIVLALIIGIVYLLTENTFALLGLLGVYLSVVISLLLSSLEKFSTLEEQNRIATTIRQNPTTWSFYQNTIPSITAATEFENDVYKTLFGQVVNDFNMQLSMLASGSFEFRGESWRRPWQQLLSQENVTFYRSAALVKSPGYWQDQPGKSSIAFNESISSSVQTKRIFVIWDELWHDEKLRQWILNQKNSGIEVAVVRRSEIPREEDLLHDFGIYGDKAVGYQFLTEDGTTDRFELHFGREMHANTSDRFSKLELYATPETTEAYLSGQAVMQTTSS